MIFALFALLCLTSAVDDYGRDYERDYRLAHQNKLLRKQQAALLNALHEITQDQESQVGARVDCKYDEQCDGYYICLHGRCSMPTVESQVGKPESKEDCTDTPASKCELCEGVKDYCSGRRYVRTTYDVQFSRFLGCSYPETYEYVDSCDHGDHEHDHDHHHDHEHDHDHHHDHEHNHDHNAYTVSKGGKCMTLDAEDPKYEYFGNMGSECESKCDQRDDCFGYSVSGYDNCLIWLQRDIMGGGEEWGGADCHIKDLHCEGNVGTEGNCYACYDGDHGKYLWGNACHAKKFGKNEYETGVCGKEYTCITDGRDIGECPYNDYCPSKRSFEVSIGAEACDSYCESWDKFMESKKDDNTQEEICDMYKTKRCRTCQDVQDYCGWKKVTEEEIYTYTVSPAGKCQTLDKEDPKYEYFGGKGSECESKCNDRPDCFGFSISGYDNCLIWLQRDIMGGGEEWGHADCHIKDLQCSGNVGEEGNCFECYNGYNGKYLWGNTCHAKKFGKDEYERGVCGKEYTCITDGKDIGECPYDVFCPSA